MKFSLPQSSRKHSIEVKAWVDNFHLMGKKISALASAAPVDRIQHDTFFACRSGRLKLRKSGQFNELIYYQRNDDFGPSEAHYQYSPAWNSVALRNSLVSAFGEAGRVRKFRRSFRVGDAELHLDRVAELGTFVEIKVSVELAEAVDSAVAEAEMLMQALDIDLFQLVDMAYVDLLNQRMQGARRPHFDA